MLYQTNNPMTESFFLILGFPCVIAGTTIDQGIEADFESSDVFLSIGRQIAYP
jgi:hypothetical protein